MSCSSIFLFFFFSHPPTTEIYTLSLHDALPICRIARLRGGLRRAARRARPLGAGAGVMTRHLLVTNEDRKSTRLNSSHRCISYAVFCLKKKKKNELNKLLKKNNHSIANTETD